MANTPQFIIVKNKTQPRREIRITELHQVIPADGKFYKLPYAIAYRYRNDLQPVQIVNDAGQPVQKTTIPNTAEVPSYIKKNSFDDIGDTYTTEIRNEFIKLGDVINNKSGKKTTTTKKSTTIVKKKKPAAKKKKAVAKKKPPVTTETIA